MSSLDQTWSTPDSLYKPLDAVFHFAFDAAAAEGNTKHERYLNVFDNALERMQDGTPVPWGRKIANKYCEGERIKGEITTCFLNPPYGSQVADFARMAAKQGELYMLPVVMLCANRTDPEWYRLWVNNSAMFKLELRERVKFTRPGRPTERSQPAFPSCLAFYGPHSFIRDRIYKLADLGFIVDLQLQRALTQNAVDRENNQRDLLDIAQPI